MALYFEVVVSERSMNKCRSPYERTNENARRFQNRVGRIYYTTTRYEDENARRSQRRVGRPSDTDRWPKSCGRPRAAPRCTPPSWRSASPRATRWIPIGKHMKHGSYFSQSQSTRAPEYTPPLTHARAKSLQTRDRARATPEYKATFVEQ